MQESEKFKTVKKYFDLGIWTVEKVKNAVKKGWITSGEFAIITNITFSD